MFCILCSNSFAVVCNDVAPLTLLVEIVLEDYVIEQDDEGEGEEEVVSVEDVDVIYIYYSDEESEEEL